MKTQRREAGMRREPGSFSKTKDRVIDASELRCRRIEKWRAQRDVLCPSEWDDQLPLRFSTVSWILMCSFRRVEWSART